MTSWEWMLVGGLAMATVLAIWRWLDLRIRLHHSEGQRAAIVGEEHRMFDFLHHLGASIAEERSLTHLYRTIVEGIEEVVAADGVALYLFQGDQLVPAHLSRRCPPLIRVPDVVREEGTEAIAKWLRLGKVSRQGEFLNETAAREGGGRWNRSGEHVLPENVSDLMAVPLSHAGKTYAILAATRCEKGEYSAHDWDVFRSAGEQSAYGLGNALLHREVQEKRQLDQELRLAGEVQKVLLPSGNPDWAGYRVRGVNLAARIISGDYFDFVPMGEDRHGVMIADVSGKGVGAGLMMASCRSALRARSGREEGPAATLSALNRQIFEDMRQDMFVSAALVNLENDSGRFTLARAGHDPPLLFRKRSGVVERLKPGGLALGIDRGPVFERVLKEKEFTMETGDILLLYTDGVNEAVNGKEQEFGRERLMANFAELAGEGADRVVEGLPEQVAAFIGETPQSDDITLVVIEKM
jgi:sigma-B regulation protein RsbU (phosphoserine phosphatase)